MIWLVIHRISHFGNRFATDRFGDFQQDFDPEHEVLHIAPEDDVPAVAGGLALLVN